MKSLMPQKRHFLQAFLLASVLAFPSSSRSEGSVDASSLTPLLQQQPEMFRLLYRVFDLTPTSIGTGTRVGNRLAPGIGGARISPYTFLINLKSDTRKENDFLVTVNARTIFLDENGRVTPRIEEAVSFHEILRSITITNNPDTARVTGKALLTQYITSVTPNDYMSSSGTPLNTLAGVLAQDRANVHRFGNPDGDQMDSYFINVERRKEIGQMPIEIDEANGADEESIIRAVTSGSPIRLGVKVYLNSDMSKSFSVSLPRLSPKTYAESNEWE
ncbi:hypothetical protein [Vulcanococcus limneticus]|uniref:hypothetical protein n=1 Tax=Vulcanococcus limneticus TaxID=2170428 RepID=UPI00398C0137